jgi:hypothetical protein
VRGAHDGRGTAEAVTELAQGNDYIGIEIATAVSPAATAWWSPIETVSNSEAGFERVYQGSALLLSWRINVAPGEGCSVAIVQRASVRDRDGALPGNPSARGLRATG